MSDPIGSLQETRLWAYLAEVEPPLALDALDLVSKVAPLLDSVEAHFPYFTRHDIHHSVEVAKRIADLINPSCLEVSGPVALSGAEAFLLLAAAYTHDIGMTVLPNEADFRSRALRSSPIIQSQYLRERHAERGSRYITLYGSRLGIPNTFLESLGKMVLAHNLPVEEVRLRLRKRCGIAEQQVDLRQLTCLFCIADALQLGHTRVLDGVIERIQADTSPDATRAYLENMMHLGIGDGVTIRDDGRITISGRFLDPDVWAWAKQSVDRIDLWVQEYCLIAAQSIRPLLKVRRGPFICDLSISPARVFA